MDQEQIQELDRILQLWVESYQNKNGQGIHASDMNSDCCQHEVQMYIGFCEQYEYCSKCDAKKINGAWITK